MVAEEPTVFALNFLKNSKATDHPERALPCMAYLIRILKILLFNVVLFHILKWSGLDMSGSRANVALTFGFWGAIMFFWGANHMLSAGFFAGIHGTRSWVNTATPALVWRLAGGMMWVIGGICLYVMA